MTRAILYIRVSTDMQVEHGFSIPEQRRDLRDHARREDLEVIEEIVDEGHSGAVGIRPGLDRVMELAQAGEIDVVLAKKRNRLFRDRYIRMGYERALLEYDVKLLALDDTHNRLADAVLDEFGDYFRDEIRKNTVAGRLEKARSGRLLRNHTPIYGFAYVEVNGERDVDFEVVPSKMAVVERVFREVAGGSSLRSVKLGLDEDSTPTPGGSRFWLQKTLREMVFEDAYRPYAYEELAPLLTAEARERIEEGREYGVVWFPRRKVKTLDPDPARDYRRAQKVEQHAREDQVPIPVVSSGIPAALIDRARAMIRDNRPPRRAGHREFELAGILRCAHCGRSMVSSRTRNRSRDYFYYICSSYKRDGREACQMNRSLPAHKVERLVLHAVLEAVKDRDELIRQALERFEDERDRLLRGNGVDAASWRRELEGLERQRAQYQRAFAEEAMSLEDLRARTAEVEAEKVHVEGLLAEQESRTEKLEELEAERDHTIDLIENGMWTELGITEPEARRHRYTEIGLQAQADVDGKIRLTWKFAGEPLVDTMDLTSRPARSPTRRTLAPSPAARA